MHQHLASALLHIEDFHTWLEASGSVFHPLGDGLGANTVLAFIEHVGILGEETHRRRTVTGIGGRNVAGDGRGQGRDGIGHDTAPCFIDLAPC
ncbi:hypothetical protein D3C84_1020110 [compost metagenome]